jgi:hypothetical protein
MKGDFSRLTYNPNNHYVGVLHQQGRVFLDSDWNEDVLERLAVLRQELNDIIGDCGVPEPGTAFQISPGLDPSDFHIAAGRCYVNGNLCRLESDTTYLSQPDLLDPPPIIIPPPHSTAFCLVYLEVWHRLITYLEDESLREIALKGPDTATRLKTIAQVKIVTLPNSVTDFSLANILQFLPTPGAGTLTTLQPVPAQVPNLCQLSDPGNFTGRENHLYRVQIHDRGEVIGGSLSIGLAADATAGATTVTLAAALNSTQIAVASRVGIVTVTDNAAGSEQVSLAGISSDGRTLSLAGAFRVTHAAANNASAVLGPVATFKWSRDNASFAVRVTAVQNDRLTLTLSSLGRDTATALRQGDLVEISDDSSELGRARGHLTNLVADPDPDSLTVVLHDPLPSSFLVPGLQGPSGPPSTPQTDRHLILRRWDGAGQASAVYDDIATPAMNLGDGVHIQFGGSDLRSGDYWHFTTRTADGSVEALTNAAPAGIVRHWCPLAVLRWAPSPLTSPPTSPPSGVVVDRVADFRNTFPALIHFPRFDTGIHITGVLILDPSGRVSSQLTNDTQIQINSFGGIAVQCDTVVDPASIVRPTCYVTAENPFGSDNQGNASGYQLIKVSGSVGSNGSTISWQPTPGARALLQQFVSSIPPNDQGILTRLTLRGNFIWDRATRSLYLDGDAFGVPGGSGSNVSLSLPSGDKERGGDFETWFWLVATPPPPVEVFSLSSNPNQIYPAPTGTALITLTLTAAAPSTGLPVTIVNNNRNLVTLINPPSSVPAGATSVTFTAQAAGNNTGPATITASVTQSPPDLNTVSTILTVVRVDLTGTLALTPANGNIPAGSSGQGTVTLTGPAPSGIPPVTVTSSDLNIARVDPPSFTIPAGNNSQSFTIQGVNPGSATITASLAGIIRTAVVTVTKNQAKENKENKDNKDVPDRKDAKDARDGFGKGPQRIREQIFQPAVLVSDPARPPIQSLAPATTIGTAQLGSDGEPPAATARAFIRPEERPGVGTAILNG